MSCRKVAKSCLLLFNFTFLFASCRRYCYKFAQCLPPLKNCQVMAWMTIKVQATAAYTITKGGPNKRFIIFIIFIFIILQCMITHAH
jgi:hypothetical protein